jgi:hypothetical protein
MAHFAELDADSIVLRVLVITNEDCQDSDGNESEAVGIAFCKSLFGADTNWKQTSYNNNMRYRYAGIGLLYNEANDVFTFQKPFPSWSNLNLTTYEWNPPVAYPADAGLDDEENPTKIIAYSWDETNIQWVRHELPYEEDEEKEKEATRVQILADYPE